MCADRNKHQTGKAVKFVSILSNTWWSFCWSNFCNTKITPTLNSSLAGYWKWTPSNLISPLSPGGFSPVLLRLSISGTRSSTEKMAPAEPLATANASRCGVVRPIFIAPDSTPNRTYMTIFSPAASDFNLWSAKVWTNWIIQVQFLLSV